MNVWKYSQQVDRSGQHFYREMAQRARQTGVKRVFALLERDETELLERRQRMRARFAGTADAESAALDGAGNVYEELRGREAQLQIGDDLSAWQLGVAAQRRVVEQYRTALTRERRPEVQCILAALADEEARILREMEFRFEFANAPNAYLAWGEFSNLGEFHNFGRDVG